MKKAKSGMIIVNDSNYPDGAVVYDFTRKLSKAGKKITLLYSKIDNGWSNPGSKAASITDTGDGYIIKMLCGSKRVIELDYSEFRELEQLIDLMGGSDDCA